MTITNEEMIGLVMHPTLDACNKSGISLERLVKDLKKELKAKETKLIKVKKNMTAEKVMEEIQAALGGAASKAKAGNFTVVYETAEEVLLAVDMINWGTRQTARMDAHKLRGDYPATTNKHVFPDKNGQPQDLKEIFNMDERLKRINFLMEEAERAKKAKNGGEAEKPAS